jgi:hypothetical protein
MPTSSGGEPELYLAPRCLLLHSRAIPSLSHGIETFVFLMVVAPPALEAGQMCLISLFFSGASVSLFSPGALLGSAFPELGEFSTLVLQSVGQVSLVCPLLCVCLQASSLRSLDLDLSLVSQSLF